FIAQLKSMIGDRLAGVIHTVNDDVADRAKLEHGPSDIIYGKPTIVENLLGLNFEISMQSFFQTNPASAEKLYQKVINYTVENNDLEGKVVMDLFCGTGTIGQLLASQIKNVKIIGVDIVESAIVNARKNAELNGIKNLEFYAADVGKFLKEFPEYQGKIDTIILDPPRAGIIPKALLMVIALGAKRIVYVSCNPATQARDSKELREAGYELKKLSLVDQFPHTAHIESIMVFEKI
ncbi:MAG: 23S rRNA (uracil1939-C5)-methyltransferase, partial [Flavobacteriales bacterium]